MPLLSLWLSLYNCATLSYRALQARLKRQATRPSLPSVLMANVQSLENTFCELRARLQLQKDIREFRVFCFYRDLAYGQYT